MEMDMDIPEDKNKIKAWELILKTLRMGKGYKFRAEYY